MLLLRGLDGELRFRCERFVGFSRDHLHHRRYQHYHDDDDDDDDDDDARTPRHQPQGSTWWLRLSSEKGGSVEACQERCSRHND